MTGDIRTALSAVMPAKAGIQYAVTVRGMHRARTSAGITGLPAFAGNDNREVLGVSRPPARRFLFKAAGPPHQERFERHVFGRAVFVRLGPHADDAVAQPPLQ